MNRYLAGALGGLLATVPMTVTMVTLFRRLPRYEQYPLPPSEITQSMLRKGGQGRRLSETRHTELTLASHFAYGALTGALYPVVLRRVEHPLVYGSGYGVAIWAASYLGWVPAFRLLAPASRQPTSRRRLMISAHLVWGAGTVWLGERLAQQEPRARN